MKNIGILAVVILFYHLVATTAFGIEPAPGQSESGWLHEIRAGVLWHDVDGLWSGSREEGGVDFNAEIIFSRPGFSLEVGTVRPNFGLSVNNQGDTSKLYAGVLWELEMESGLFLNLGVGVAVHNGESESSEEDKKELGSRVLFRIPIELGYALSKHHAVSIMFDHISNAYLARPNEGLDTLGLRYGYRF
jgi:lipid A 3-O-deacylase